MAVGTGSRRQFRVSSFSQKVRFTLLSFCGLYLILASMACSIGSGAMDSMGTDGLPSLLPLEATPSAGMDVIFTDVTEGSGIGFVHSFGDNDFSNLVEAVGGGVAFFDYDLDGWTDLYLTTGKWTEGLSSEKPTGTPPTNRLYRNRGNGTFEDVTERAGVAAEDYFSMGLAVGDFDNDGYPDIYLCNYGTSILFHNQGDGTFRDVALAAGVANEGFCTVAATWLDYDRDGLLDLYVSSYIDFDPDYSHYYAPDGFPGPLSYKTQADHLYRNLGENRFEDVSESVGILGLEGRGMSVTSIDFNGDNYPDLYVTNDATENFLLQNNEGRSFAQVALESGVGYNGMGDSTASMGVDFGDFNNDSLLDFFVSDNSLSSLYRNEGDGFYMDTAVESGIALNSAQFVGWGSFFFDPDNDGDLDILKVNSDLSRLFGQEDQLFLNNGQGTFFDASADLGEYFSRTLLGRGAAFGDYDNDGDLDVLVSNIAGTAVLLRNDGGNNKNWLSLTLTGTKSNREAIGAFVKVTVGNQTLSAYKKSNAGYLSTSDPRLHFGLGTADKAERIEILWPSGQSQTLEDVPANQFLEIVEEAS